MIPSQPAQPQTMRPTSHANTSRPTCSDNTQPLLQAGITDASPAAEPPRKQQRCSPPASPSLLLASTCMYSTTTIPTTTTTTTSFSQLPDHIQTIIFSSAAAPLHTCKTAAAVSQDAQLMAEWLWAGNDWGSQALYAAAGEGRWDVCTVLLEQGCFHADSYLSDTLHLAAGAGQLELVQKLLKARAWEDTWWSRPRTVKYSDSDDDPYFNLYSSSSDEEDESEHPLLAAAGNGHADVCSLLLKQGVHYSIVHEAVCAAAAAGHLAVVQRLVSEEKADLSRPHIGDSAMFKAAAGGHASVVQFFLDMGADVLKDSGPWSGWSHYSSCVLAAAEGGSPEVFSLFLDQGIALEPEWQTALYTAAEKGHTGLVQYLVCLAAADALSECAAAAEQWQQQQKGQQHSHQHDQQGDLTHELMQLRLQQWGAIDDALVIAASRGHCKVVSVLLHSRFKPSQKSLLIALGRAAGVRRMDILHLLFQHGADATLVGWALARRQWSAAELLISRGARVCGQTLQYAWAHKAPVSVLKTLLGHGAADDDNKVIYAAAQRGQQEVVALLLGASEQSTSKDLLTGRLAAALCGAASGAQVLLLETLCLQLQRDLQESDPDTTAGSHDQILAKALEAVLVGCWFQLLGYVNPANAHSATVWDLQQLMVMPASPERLAAVDCLLRKGASPDGIEGAPLLLATILMQHGILQQLLDAGATKTGLPLFLAAVTANPDALSRLLAATEGPVDQDGLTLLYAAMHGSVSMVRSLIHKGSNVKAALSAAVATDNVQAAVTLLEHPTTRIQDESLKQGLLQLAQKTQSFSLMWSLCTALGVCS